MGAARTSAGGPGPGGRRRHRSPPRGRRRCVPNWPRRRDRAAATSPGHARSPTPRRSTGRRRPHRSSRPGQPRRGHAARGPSGASSGGATTLLSLVVLACRVRTSTWACVTALDNGNAEPRRGLRVSDPTQAARDALQQIHQAAVKYRDNGLHQAAKEVARVARSLGQDPGPIETYRPCPVCGAEPGAHCISVPGHSMVSGMHSERTQE